jgi:uncharacterized delta-60 repeat protein
MKILKISLLAIALITMAPTLQFAMSKMINGHSVTVSAGAATTSGISYSAGSTMINGTQHIALVRYAADGAPDKTFGTGGLATAPVGVNSSANAITIQPDGKILVEGTSSNGAFKARFNSNGSLDTSFGVNGIEKKK